MGPSTPRFCVEESWPARVPWATRQAWIVLATAPKPQAPGRWMAILQGPPGIKVGENASVWMTNSRIFSVNMSVFCFCGFVCVCVLCVVFHDL